MSWKDLQRRLDEAPGFRADYEEEYPHEDVALAIAGLRAEFGLTQKEFGDRVGMKQPNVARLESGKYNPKVDVLKGIAKAFDRQFDIAFRDREPEASQVTTRNIFIGASSDWHQVITMAAGVRIQVGGHQFYARRLPDPCDAPGWFDLHASPSVGPLAAVAIKRKRERTGALV